MGKVQQTKKNSLDGCSIFLISFSSLNPTLILRGKASWRENMVAAVALLETVFHAVYCFGDRDLAEEELCRTENRHERTRVEDLRGGEPRVQGSWLDLEKVRREFLALA
jgi:hypothetical protein